MKKVILSAFMLTAMTATMYAENATNTNLAKTADSAVVPQQDNKTKVDPAALPDAVKNTLASDAYKGWTVSNAWLVKSPAEYYTVELKKEDKTITVNIDKDGKVKQG